MGRLVVETFKDRARKVFVGINDKNDSSRFIRTHRRTTDNQTGEIIVDDELHTEERRD